MSANNESRVGYDQCGYENSEDWAFDPRLPLVREEVFTIAGIEVTEEEYQKILNECLNDGLINMRLPSVDLVYGIGVAGSKAKMLVESCACNECGGVADRTVDFDWVFTAELEQIPVCGDCEPGVIEQVWVDLHHYGKIDIMLTFSTNGRGRW